MTVKRRSRKLIPLKLLSLFVNPIFGSLFHIVLVVFYRYKNDPEILAMTNLIAAYQRNEIIEFEKILKVRTLSFFDLYT